MRFLWDLGGGKVEIKIGKRIISNRKFETPYIIAEAGVNHEGSMEKAKMMIEEVSRAGADAIKFQAYKAKTLASKYSPAYWDTRKEPTKSQYELFKKYDKFGKKEFEELADYAKSYKVDFIVTPFDINSVNFLEPLVPVYKVASADITNKPLLKYIASKGKPIFLSTGASTISEVWKAIEWIKEEGNNKIVPMHCVLNYPTEYEHATLGAIIKMKEIFSDYIVGYSDHTLPDHVNEVLVTAWLLGAQVIEKHYTWNKKLPGNDHYHSMDYSDLKGLIEKMKFILKLIGKIEKHYLSTEIVSRKYARRSLVAARKIIKGKKLEVDDITWKRPGTGIPPWMIDNVIGGIALDNINEDEILTFSKVRLRDIETDNS